MARPKRKKTFGDFIMIVLMVIALGVFAYAAYTLYGFYMEYKAGTDEYDALNSNYTTGQTEDYSALENESENQRTYGKNMKTVHYDGRDIQVPLMKNPIDFAGLQAKNSDLVGWIQLRALNISYPVLQGDDNEFYLHHTFEKEYNFAGCIFLNCDNNRDFSDQNSIVYGHNMRNGSMFGTIKQFADKDVFNKSKYIWMYTKDLIFEYRIFSVEVVGNTGLAYQTMFNSKEFKELMEHARQNSEVDGSDVEVTEKDHLITLSTCTGDSSTRRVVLGKLVQIYASDYS